MHFSNRIDVEARRSSLNKKKKGKGDIKRRLFFSVLAVITYTSSIIGHVLNYR